MVYTTKSNTTLMESLRNITAKILFNQHVLCLIKTHAYGIRLHHIKVYNKHIYKSGIYSAFGDIAMNIILQ